MLAWVLGAGAVLFVRFRSDFHAYKDFHRWLAAQGVPDLIRNLDNLVIFVAAAIAGACVAATFRGGSFLAHLGVRLGHPGWFTMVPIALLPMIIGGATLGWYDGFADVISGTSSQRVISGVVEAPIAEEILFRGLLVGVAATALGWRGPHFWLNALAAACIFALTHITWTAPGFTSGLPTLLVTGLGGVWFAWLFSRWMSLWVPLLLHAGMNLGWLLADATGGAGGGGWATNALRAATITIATIWTIRATRQRD